MVLAPKRCHLECTFGEECARFEEARRKIQIEAAMYQERTLKQEGATPLKVGVEQWYFSHAGSPDRPAVKRFVCVRESRRAAV